MDKKSFAKLLGLLGLPLAIYQIAISYGLTEIFAFYTALTCGAIYSWIVEVVPASMAAVALPVLYLVTGVAEAKVVFSPWTTTVPWICLGGLLIGQLTSKSGLATRLAYKCMLWSGNSFWSILFGLMLAGLLVAPFIPTVLGKASIFFILGIGMCKVLNFVPTSKESAAVMMVCFFASACPAYAFLTGCVQIPAALKLMETVSSLQVYWFEYAYHNFLPTLWYSFLAFFSVLLVTRPGKMPGIKETIQKQYLTLGSMQKEEKKAAVFLLVILILLISESFHQLNAAWCMVLMAFVAFLPGINLLDNKDLETLGFPLIYFLAGAMSIGSVAAHIGVAEELASLAAQFLAPGQTVLHLFLSFLLGTFTVLFLSPVTGMSAMSVPITQIALQLELDPRLMLYSFFYGVDMYFLPYQYALTLLLYSYGRVTLAYMSKILLVKFILCLIFLVPVYIFYWHLLGLW